MNIRIAKSAGSPSQRELERQAVQSLANRVSDEAHWQQILSTTQTQEQREELERVVGPMLSFRRSAPCTTPECESGEHGVWQPVLVVASPLAPDEPSWVPIELKLCTSCKESASVEHFLTDDIWAQVLSAWPDPTLPPVRRLVTLQFDRVH